MADAEAEAETEAATDVAIKAHIRSSAGQTRDEIRPSVDAVDVSKVQTGSQSVVGDRVVRWIAAGQDDRIESRARELATSNSSTFRQRSATSQMTTVRVHCGPHDDGLDLDDDDIDNHQADPTAQYTWRAFQRLRYDNWYPNYCTPSV